MSVLPRDVSRRAALAALSASAASLLPASALAAATSDVDASRGLCLLTPQSVEGPYYLDPHLVRSDIVEGRPGVPLRVQLRVIEAGPCTPLPKTRVDIWHADARGIYSGYEGQGDGRDLSTVGEKFLRGTQFSDSGGWVAFDTIYPGWYAGRATHVHFKVFLDERSILTGQLYFPDALNEFIYTQVPAYRERARSRNIVNANDGIVAADDPDRRSFCAIKEERERYVASLVLGVDRNGKPQSTEGGVPPPPGGAPAGGPPPETPVTGDRAKTLVPGI